MSYTNGLDKPSDYFNTVLYTGTENSNTISVGFEPDFTWIKRRNSARDHQLFNSITGANTVLSSNLTSAEEGTGAGGWTPNSDGFVVHQHVKTNSNGDTYVGWNWKAGTSFTNDASATGIGSIDSSGSVNTDAGFSICTYTGTGSVGTIKHGLNTKPDVIICKSRSGAEEWRPYFSVLGATKGMRLNGTNAEDTDAAYWNNTEPTSSVFTVGTNGGTNGSSVTTVAYCFHSVKGYSKFGSYTGNGNADGTFVYTGFKPSFVMCKRTDSTGVWFMCDNKRVGFNGRPNNTATVGNPELSANDSRSEAGGNTNVMDIFSNGFKLIQSGGEINGSGASFIFMAFAENPFVTSTGVPATAR